MKINKPTGVAMVNPYQKQPHSFSEKHKSAAKRDQLQISDEAKFMLVETQDPIRPDRKEKVEKLKVEIESGNYQIDNHKVAERLYQFWFKN